MVKLLEGDKEFKVLMYHGASIHVFIDEIKELRMMGAAKCPANVIKPSIEEETFGSHARRFSVDCLYTQRRIRSFSYF
jgi:hypothetical protein